MIEAGDRPNGEQFVQPSGANPFDAFVERLAPTGETPQSEERGLQLVHPFYPFNLMRKFNSAYERKQWNELGFHPTEEQNIMVRNVKIAYGIIAEPFCGETAGGEPSRIYQDIIVHEIGIDQMYYGNNRVVLTDEERERLVKIAKAAGIPCDPERSEYFYGEIPTAYWLDKHKRYRTPPTVVDADQ